MKCDMKRIEFYIQFVINPKKTAEFYQHFIYINYVFVII